MTNSPSGDSDRSFESKAAVAAMHDDDSKGATGDWVALLGFSQGEKLAACLLFLCEERGEIFGRGQLACSFRFGVLIAGEPGARLRPDAQRSSRRRWRPAYFCFRI
jgi:hypothetical protein